MLLVLVLIAAATTAGVVFEQRDRAAAHRAADRVVRLIVWVLMPFVVLFVVPHLELASGVGVGIALAFCELAVVGVLAFVIADRVLGLSRPVTGSVTCAAVLANTGYLGVPLTAALLGRGAVPHAVAWDAMVSNVMLYGPAFAIGAALGTQAGETGRERLVAFLTRNPVLYALVIGLVAPESFSPDAVFDVAIFVAGSGVLPLGFFLLGVNLMEERDDTGTRSPLVLLGVTHDDDHERCDRLADKVRELRIFPDAEGRMNEPLGEREALVVSQFTLYGDARKGTRPSYVQAAPAEIAEPLYERFRERLGAQGGVFGAHMDVTLVGDGPVTLLLER